MAAAPRATAPQFIGPYLIDKPSGPGHPNGLFRAQDTRIGRPVLVSIRHAEEDSCEALLRNARVASSFTHPRLLRLLEIGEDQALQRVYLVSRYVDGISLRAALSRRRYSFRRSLGLAIQLAETFADVQDANLVHGELTPDHIIVGARGDCFVLHVGLGARSESGPVCQADGYLSPERVCGMTVDRRADVFSLGAILFTLISGCPPPPERESYPIAWIHEQIPLSRMSIGTELAATLSRALAADVDARCGSAAAFAAELRAIVARLDVQPRKRDPLP